MGEVVRFVPKPELERARLIREARAIYESIFPTENGPVLDRNLPCWDSGKAKARLADDIKQKPRRS
jgi:hypothetical protein